MSVVSANVTRHYPWLTSVSFGCDAETKEEVARQVAAFLPEGEHEVRVFATSEGFPFRFRVRDGEIVSES